MPNQPQTGTEGAAAAGRAERMTPLRELQLIQAHRRGDAGAIGELLREYEQRIYAVCIRMVRDEHDARDLAQDAMVKIIQGLDGYDGRSKLSTWIIRVTMNCCLSHLRKQRLRRHGPLDHDRPAGTGGELPPARGVEQAEMQGVVARALGSLDPHMRAVLILRDLQDLEYGQIAEVLEVPVGTVKSRLFRARVALRTAVEAQGGRGADEP
jgi:RNA polymerase sigma-70 factor (ECF subfamily)